MLIQIYGARSKELIINKKTAEDFTAVWINLLTLCIPKTNGDPETSSG